MRVSDADRDRAVSELSEHFQVGRLTLDEFEERSARALSAKTGRELRDLFGDLPPRSTPAAAPAPPGSPAQRGGAGLGRLLVVLPIVASIAIVAAASGHRYSHGHHVAGGLVSLAIICLVCMRVFARRGAGRV